MATRIEPVNRERFFAPEELFFSTTDAKGIITSGNSVFARVSGYPESSLLGKPHNLIRHPDMPRIVFKLLWEYLEAGKPIAAFVKNMASDGAYYWVMATAAPIPGGYLSVRFKPCGPFFSHIGPVYADLLKVEQEAEGRGVSRRDAMELSRARLLEILGSLGFSDYDHFIQTALPTELKQRDAAAHRGEPEPTDDAALQGCQFIASFMRSLFGQLETFSELNRKLSEKSAFVLELAGEIRLLSQNSQVAARRLESSGATLSKVASIMGADSDEAVEVVRTLTRHIGSARHWLSDLSFLASIARLQSEMAADFLLEVSPTDPRVLALSQCASVGSENLFGSMDRLHRDLRSIGDLVDRLAEVLRTLEMIHLTGKLEVARLASAGAFQSLFERAGEQIGSAKAQMAEFIATLAATFRITSDTGHARVGLAVEFEAMQKRAGAAAA